MKRREFLQFGAAGLVVGISAACGSSSEPEPASGETGRPDAAEPPADLDGSLPRRTLGRTGCPVSLVALGGQALLQREGNEDAAVALIRRAVHLGVNYFDTGAGYGPSRRYLGVALRDLRDGVFLASKTDRRDRDGAWRHIEESLELLRTDRLDLMQIHGLGSDDEADKVLGSGGAFTALREAREQGIVRFLGVTGHRDPSVLLRCIHRERFDTILMPLNCADPHHLPFAGELLAAANALGMGVLVMKVFGKGYLFRKGGFLYPAGVRSPREALLYALSHPIHGAVVGCDTVGQLEECVAIARTFQPLEVEEMRRLESVTLPYATRASGFKDWSRVPLARRIRYVPFFDRGIPSHDG